MLIYLTHESTAGRARRENRSSVYCAKFDRIGWRATERNDWKKIRVLRNHPAEEAGVPSGRQTKGKINGIPPEFREAATDKCFRDWRPLRFLRRWMPREDSRRKISQPPILSWRQMNASEPLSYCDRRCSRLKKKNRTSVVQWCFKSYFSVSSSQKGIFRCFISQNTSSRMIECRTVILLGKANRKSR